MNSLKDRLNSLIETLKISKNEFAREIGTSSAMISKITTKDVNFGIDIYQKIIGRFPNINEKWLLTGIGEIWLGSDLSQTKSENVRQSNDENINENLKKRISSHELSQQNSSIIQSKMAIAQKVFDEILIDTFSIEQLNFKTKNLLDLQSSYYNKVNRELDKNYGDLYKVMRLAENVEALADLIWTVIRDYIHHRPNPFDAFQYIDLQNKSEHIPDTIDYKIYKQDVINWLQKIESYQDAITEFYNHGEHFLKQLKPLDVKDIID